MASNLSRTIPRPLLFRHLLRIVYLGAWVWITWRLGQEFFDHYSGDSDHEIYYGQRVLAGELPWTHEYFNRLPASQFVQAVAAAFGGVNAWRVISIGGSLLCGMFIAQHFPYVLSEKLELPVSKGKDISKIVVVLFFLWMTVVPGGFTTINALPASLMMAGTISILRNHAHLRPSARWLTILFPAVLFALAISIRPYFFGPFVVLSVWLTLAEGMSKSVTKVRTFHNSGGIVFVLTGVSGVVLNVVPYILTGNMQAFIDGIFALLDPEGSISPFTQRANLFLVGTVGLSLGSAELFRRRHTLRFGSLPLMSIVALTAMIYSQHFWGHYAAFYGWYLALTFGLITASLITKRRMSEHPYFASLKLWKFLAVMVAVASLTLSYGLFVRDEFQDRRHDYPALISELYREYGVERVSFLAPRDMYSHWVFSESRRGLPGGGATRPIRDGLWSEKRQFDSFARPTSLEAYCQIIRESGVRFVLVVEGYLPDSCFIDSRGEIWETLLLDSTADLPTDILVYENPEWSVESSG